MRAAPVVACATHTAPSGARATAARRPSRRAGGEDGRETPVEDYINLLLILEYLDAGTPRELEDEREVEVNLAVRVHQLLGRVGKRLRLAEGVDRLVVEEVDSGRLQDRPRAELSIRVKMDAQHRHPILDAV